MAYGEDDGICFEKEIHNTVYELLRDFWDKNKIDVE